MSSRRLSTAACALTAALSILLGASSLAASDPPARLAQPDPLLSPAPSLQLTLPADGRPAADKITGSLWARAAAGGSDLEIPVVLTLWEGESAGGDGADDEGDAEALRLELLAAGAHRFAARAEASGLTGIRALSHFPIAFGTVPAGRLLGLASLPEVRTIEEDRPLFLARAEGGPLIRATQLRNQLQGDGEGIGVAVVDSGVDGSHPELAGRVTVHADFADPDGSGLIDADGHGTAVAGIVAGSSGGMAPAAHVWAAKVFDAQGNSSLSFLLDALNALFASRNDFGGLHVVNLSIGDGTRHNQSCDASNPALATAAGQLVQAGVALFAASGNEAYKDGISSPACLTGVIAVGAVYDADIGPAGFDNCSDAASGADRITCYSNSGAPLDVLAPSHCARTPSPGGGYGSCFGGTSAASPYAAGVAAQLLSLHPGTSPAALRQALAGSGRPLSDVNGVTRNRIDALDAHDALAGGGPGGPCQPDAFTLCLDDQPGDGRFRVEVLYDGSQSSGRARAIPLGSLGVARGGLFWIGRQDNPEMLVKVLNACAPPFNRFWVFYAATTNQGLLTTVTDTVTGRRWSRINLRGTAALPVQDTQAFPCT